MTLSLSLIKYIYFWLKRNQYASVFYSYYIQSFPSSSYFQDVLIWSFNFTTTQNFPFISLSYNLLLALFLFTFVLSFCSQTCFFECFRFNIWLKSFSIMVQKKKKYVFYLLLWNWGAQRRRNIDMDKNII